MSIIELKDSPILLISTFLFYIKDKKIMLDAYIYHLDCIKEPNFETPSVKSIFIVNVFPNVFVEELPRVHSYYEIEFRINFLLILNSYILIHI